MLIIINYIYLRIHIKRPKIKTTETHKKTSVAKTTELKHGKPSIKNHIQNNNSAPPCF